ncbi:P-loop NTPase fold protein [Methylobacterium sp. J-026]|uniref:KAP family P-loop NTPase fold protein n=1 Tax=Methylobacterium sp. J-026 TaxID=2836624 RepID=UPI001FB91006|nr:P-loop NTPase fold protein [Methylobacterium sp. J-026]MCJ2137389.1 P-loop NTPase fold protein [Methylobacterium sp. J-026]
MTNSTDQSLAESRPLSGDRPIENAAQDRLGYAPFARAIATSIVKRPPSDGIVYAIHGPWGSGKTSAVNMLVEAMEELEARKVADDRIIVVRFNPWWFSEQSDLTKMFFSELAASLDKKVATKVSEGLRKVGRKLTGSKELLSALVGMAPGGGLVAPLIKNGLEALQPYLNENDSLDKARQELISALKEQGQRILVIIDDVDRLPADEIKQIFRLVKSVADLPSVVYLLVFDRDIARRALGEPATTDGPEWLEKIVQASFDLPAVHEVDLRQVLIDGINELIAHKRYESSTRDMNILYGCIFPWIKTPRDVGRLLNALGVSLWPVIDDVNIIDFVAIETLRTFEPRLYYYIRDHQAALTGLADRRMRDDDGIGKDLLDKVSPTKSEQAKETLRKLFPKLQAIWDNSFYDGEFLLKWERARLVCTSRHFPTYFTFALGDDALRASDVSDLLESLREMANFVDTVQKFTAQKRRNGTTKAALVFSAIQNRSTEFSEIDATAAAKTLLNAGSFLSGHHDRGSVMSAFPFTWDYWFALSPMLKRVPYDLRVGIILDAIQRASSLVVLLFVVLALEGEHGLHKGGADLPPEQQTIDEAGLKQIQDSLLHKLQNMAVDGTLIQQLNLRELLSRWVLMTNSDTARAWTKSLMDNDAAVLALAEAALTSDATQSFGDYVATQYFSLDRVEVSKYLDVDALAQRLVEINAKQNGGVDLAQRFLRALNAKGRFDNLQDE